jgi:NAD(P)H-flavin reductase
MRDAMLPRPFRVQDFKRETGDTFTLRLAPESGRGSLRFSPGQFNMIYAFGAGEVPISISGDPAAPDRCVHTIRAVGPVTRALARMHKGAVVGLRGPFGNPWPLDRARGKDVVVIAGGIGLAPLRPAIYQLLKHSRRYGRLSLLYGARTPDDILYPKELKRWGRRKDLRVEVTVDHAQPGWTDHVGVVPKLIPRARFDPLHAVAMICGPEIMMRFAILELERLGMSGDRIFLSMERSMKCGIGFCGHCQYGGSFVCKDGPVYPYSRVRDVFFRKEL